MSNKNEKSKIFDLEHVIFNSDAKTQEEAFKEIASKAVKLKAVKDANKLIAGFQAREQETSTGLEDGFAIPHARIKEVLKPIVIFIRFANPIKWKTFDESDVKVAIALIIPENKSSDIHLKLLTDIAKKLLDQKVREILKTTNDNKIIVETLMTEQKAQIEKQNNYKGYIIAITACPAGVAHTYMAAQKIEDYAKQQGYLVKVEKQGANGFEDKLTPEDVANANVLIIAADVTVREQDRFKDIPIVRVPVAEPLHNVAAVFDQALQAKKEVKNQNMNLLDKSKKEKNKEKKWFKTKFKSGAGNLKNAVLTGISYVVPVIVAGTAIQAFVTIIGQIAGAGWITAHASWLNTLGSVSGDVLTVLLAPILSAYIAYALADKPGLTPGFLGGLACNYVTKTSSSGTVIVDGLGFLGGLIIGILAGYLMIGFKKYIVNKKIQGVLTWFVYPVFGSLIMVSLVLFGIGQPIALLINAIFGGLTNLQTSSYAALLGIIIGLMCVFDLGGPFNKVAWAFSSASLAQAASTNNLSLLVPYSCFWAAGIGTGWTTTIVTIVGRKWCNQYEKDAGKISWLLSSLGITEGAIPFALSDPFRVIPSFLLGGAVSGGLTAAFSLGSPIMGGGFITMAGMESTNGAYNVGIAILMWLIFAIIGCLISTGLILFLKYIKSNPTVEKKVRMITLNVITLGIISVLKKNKTNKSEIINQKLNQNIVASQVINIQKTKLKEIRTNEI